MPPSSQGFPVTAWSAVNALGLHTAEVVSGLRRGEPRLSAPPFEMNFNVLCGAVSAELPPLLDDLAFVDSRNNRFVQQALSEIAEPLARARERWGAGRIGICVGSSTAAMDEIEAAYAQYATQGSIPKNFDVLSGGSSEGLVRALHGLTGFEGPISIVSNACASSGKAFASARRWLQAGFVDAVLVGGSDSLCQITLRGFRSLGLLSEAPSRPFSAERRGINIGEGAAFALLEREGSGPRLLGCGECADAHHMTTPDPEGRGARRAMEAAIADAGIVATEVDHVNAHGTGTRFNDAMEARAIRDVLGSGDPVVVSTKGYVGHTLGAAGAMEAVFVLESLKSGWTPASAGAEPVDPDIALQVPDVAQEVDLRFALSNSFAFGGSNVSLVFGAPQ